MDSGRSIRVECPAKVNLSLDIVGKREDGYHFLKTVMQSIDLCDYITVTLDDSGAIFVTTNDETLTCDATNTAHKAATVFFEYTQLPVTGVSILIEKHIPMQAGLGGGSADAAGVLLALDALYQTHLDQHQLCQLGLKVGADVPFCIVGGAALAEGVGEILSPIPSLEDCWLTVVKPQVSVSTAQAYAQFDQGQIGCVSDTQSLVAAIVAQDLLLVGQSLCNVFEQVIDCDEINAVRSAILEKDALGAIMTGSGSAVFGLFDTKRKAQKCMGQLEDDYQVFLCEPVDYGVRIVDAE